MPRLKTACLLILALVLVALPAAAQTQTSDLADHLPADTLFYLYWRGAASLKKGNRDALVSLWNDPGFQPARRLIMQGVLNAAARNPRLARIPPADIEALLADPFVSGFLLPANAGAKSGGPAPKATAFLVVRAEGKAGRDLRADLQSGPKAGTGFRFTHSGLLLASADPSTLKLLVRQFDGSGGSASDSLSTLGAYREARAEIAGRPPVEFFLRVPKTSSLGPRKTPNFNTGAFLRALHMDRVHVLCGSVDLNAPAALMHVAILGDTSPGSLFDLFGTNAASFATLAAAPAGASISVYRLDIGAVFSLLVNAFSVATGPQQAARLGIISGLLSSTIIPVLGGEYAAVWPHLSPGVGDSMLVLTVNSAEAQTLFSSTLAPFVKPAGEEGNIRYFELGKRNGAAGKNGTVADTGKTENGILIALTPKLLLLSEDAALVRRSARAVTAASPPPGLAGTASFRAARAELPANLYGMSYFDMRAFNWTKWLDRMADAIARNKKDPHAAERAAALRQWAKDGGGAVLARHVHLVFGGAWKDGQGVHWRGEIH